VTCKIILSYTFEVKIISIMKVLKLTMLMLSISIAARSQTKEQLNINNVDATILTHGDMFWNPVTSKAGYEFPKGSGKHSGFATTLWVSGYDKSTGKLKVAAQTYRQAGMDYWAGPIDTVSNDTSAHTKWDKIWKVNGTDIDNFLSQTTHTSTNTANAIMQWPAKGNVNAVGQNNAVLTINDDMAPFIDADGNGLYDYTKGDYPAIKGDQALWWVFNDYRPHTESGSDTIGLQIKVMAYACSTNNQFNNATLFDFEIKNFGEQLDDAVYTIWNDIDLGGAFDDFIGFDSTRRMGVAYNADSSDTNYGTSLTQSGLLILESPADSNGIKSPVGAFTFYNNAAGPTGNPATPVQYRNYMTGLWADGTSFKTSCNSYTGGLPTKIVFPDDPSIVGGNSQKQCSAALGDKRYLISTSSKTLMPAQVVKLKIAILNTETGSNNTSFVTLRQDADFILQNGNSCGMYAPLAINSTESISNFTIEPNVTSSSFVITLSDMKKENTTIHIFDASGKTIATHQINNTSTSIDCSAYSKGLYFVKSDTTIKKLLIK
jgi:Secretion system C-terminal sorting domain